MNKTTSWPAKLAPSAPEQDAIRHLERMSRALDAFDVAVDLLREPDPEPEVVFGENGARDLRRAIYSMEVELLMLTQNLREHVKALRTALGGEA